VDLGLLILEQGLLFGISIRLDSFFLENYRTQRFIRILLKLVTIVNWFIEGDLVLT